MLKVQPDTPLLIFIVGGGLPVQPMMWEGAAAGFIISRKVCCYQCSSAIKVSPSAPSQGLPCVGQITEK